MRERGGDAIGTDSRAAVVLSAGASERFLGQPKALLKVGSETAVARIVRLCAERGYDPVVVVAGRHRTEIERALGGGPATLLDHPEWADGRTGSVQAGLRAVSGASEALVWPVDHPFVDPTTLLKLGDAAIRDALAIWFVPSFRERGGHPILLRRPAFESVAGLAPSTPLRSLLPTLGPQVCRVAVDDPGVLENADSPDAFWAANDAWKARVGAGHGP